MMTSRENDLLGVKGLSFCGNLTLDLEYQNG